MKFWDTSAIVPLCVHEPHSTIVKKLLTGDDGIIVWWGTRIECLSALTRRAKSRDMTASDERAARRVLNTLTQAWAEIQPNEPLRYRTERLLAVHALPATIALQLAAALQWSGGSTTDQGIVTFDNRLREAAHREGFIVLPEEV